MDPGLPQIPQGHTLMDNSYNNPFDVVKATDLTDDQIVEYFVDFEGANSLLQRIKPLAAMPMIVFGGKGSGKTHLMRYLSYPLKIKRCKTLAERQAVIAESRYLGMYFRCGALNANRFSGKGQSPEMWLDIFAYYMELWFGQLILNALEEFIDEDAGEEHTTLVRHVSGLFDVAPDTPFTTLADIRTHLRNLQRELDVAVNNAGLTRQVSVKIQITRGRLTFGLPRVAVETVNVVRNVQFVYLVDEFENLEESQQRYFNTLIREREAPCTFKVGVRLYGLRTRETLTRGEQNREHAEYEPLRLDQELRERPRKDLLRFSERIVARRLALSDYGPNVDGPARSVDAWFEGDDELLANLAIKAHSESDGYIESRPYLKALRKNIAALRNNVVAGANAPDANTIVRALVFQDAPVIERTSVFLLYRAWHDGKDLNVEANEIAQSAAAYPGGDPNNAHRRVLSHFRADVVATLLRDLRQPLPYVGFKSFVEMSAGLPRGLLTILKHVFTWSLFLGEKPFRAGKISVRAQTEGVREAADWFYTEARSPGSEGPKVREAITRLGELLRDIRFSDKPTECSLCTFSVNVATLSDDARLIIQHAEEWSMLLRISGGQHDRNAGRVDAKYQIHPMIAPRFDLPLARRGALPLRGEDVTAIFAPRTPDAFDVVKRRLMARVNAPFSRTKNSRHPAQRDLLESRDE